VSRRILIRGGTVLALGDRIPNFVEADVLVEDDRIAEIAPSVRARDADVIDASQCIVMPGFIDGHRHCWRTLFRNLDAPNLTEESWADLTPEDAYAASIVGLLSALQAGITTVADWIDPPGSSAVYEAVLDAHRDSGARTLAVISSRSERTLEKALQRATSSAFVAYGAESPDSRPASLEWAAARDRGLRIHHHLGMHGDEPGRAVALERAGLLGDDVTLIHCSAASDEDLGSIASSGAAVVSTPAAEMTGGLGAPPIQRLIDNGIRPGLGVGDESSAPGDMFAQMRATNSIQHAEMFDLKLSGKAGLPQLLTTRDVIKYATTDGAAAIGLGDRVGSLEPGKQADILMLRTDRPNIHPVNDPIGAVVWGMDTSNVDSVLVGGKPVVRAGELIAGADRARELALASRDRLAAFAGDGGRA
jgi:5-methylthioadenosine/S-adenosylhomocysteine deaminase